MAIHFTDTTVKYFDKINLVVQEVSKITIGIFMIIIIISLDNFAKFFKKLSKYEDFLISVDILHNTLHIIFYKMQIVQIPSEDFYYNSPHKSVKNLQAFVQYFGDNVVIN